MKDQLGRSLGSLRLSVTDRCNLRCRYCMPEENYVWLPRESILTFEEMNRLAGIFASLGASKVRLTGGEPLLRHDLPTLVGMLGRQPNVTDLALTTNGLLLAQHATALRASGLRRVTVSLDTLVPKRMELFARSSKHADALAGIEAANAAGFDAVKLNTVVIRGYNDDEIVALLEYARGIGVEPRFIEYMDVGGATQWSTEEVFSQREIVARIAEHYGQVTAEPRRDPSAPAETFLLPDGFRFGVIASTTAPFCRDCDRSRITADGTWYLCLYARNGVDLREPLRNGATDGELETLVRETWTARTDRGAEARLAMTDRQALVTLEGLRADPRLEMHTRGG